jgi:hypothetical protein
MTGTPQAFEELPILRELAGHHAPVPFYLTGSMFGGVPVEVAGGEISGSVGRPVAEPHRHAGPEIYLLLSPEPGGAVIDVEVDGRRHRLHAPCAFYVPSGALHRFVTRSAVKGSFCLGILLPAQPGTPPD